MSDPVVNGAGDTVVKTVLVAHVAVCPQVRRIGDIKKHHLWELAGYEPLHGGVLRWHFGPVVVVDDIEALFSRTKHPKK